MTQRGASTAEELKQAAPHPLLRDEVRVALALLAAPLGWALHLVVSYGLVYPAEQAQSKVALHVVAVASAFCSCVSIGLGARGRRSAQRAATPDDGRNERAAFLYGCACFMGIFFLLATLAQCVPAFMMAWERA